MNCRSAESLFSSYIEDEISQEERRNLEAHFMGCRRCSLAMREVRATMSLLTQMPDVALSPRFDEDVYARIRSGEGLRPSAADVIRELFSPARLRPVFMAGAGACAMALAVLVSPLGQDLRHPNRGSVAPPIVSAPAPAIPELKTGTASAPAPTVEERTALVPAPSSTRRTSPVHASVAPSGIAERDSIVDGQVPYSDEIINDMFYLERGRQGQDPAVVPVNGAADDGVYIVF